MHGHVCYVKNSFFKLGSIAGPLLHKISYGGLCVSGALLRL